MQPASCPNCGDMQIVYADEIVSITLLGISLLSKTIEHSGFGL